MELQGKINRRFPFIKQNPDEWLAGVLHLLFGFAYPKYARSDFEREVWRKRRIAFSLICRTRSRVSWNRSPISSSVSECSRSSPK